MHGSDDDPLIARVAGELRRPVPTSPDFDARVMASVRRAPLALPVRAWAWLREPRTLVVSPLGGLAMAACLAALVVAGVWAGRRSEGRPQASDLRPRTSDLGPQASGASGAAALASATVTFVLLAPDAHSVALAGDFDGWDSAQLPMRREPSGLWSLDVPLTPGRYQYAFVVDGRRFVADPAAPRAVGDDFGTPSSVVTVDGGAHRAAGGAL